MAATCYGAASCRLFTIEFVASDCFGGYFDVYNNMNVQNEMETCKSSIGLYQWLQPFEDDMGVASSGKWDDGYCVGYSMKMLNDYFRNVVFETSRGFGVFAVLLSFVVVIWTILLTCIQMNTCQTLLYRFCTLAGVIATGLTFLMKLSPICASPDIFDGGSMQSCRIDHGGYAMIVGSFMWFTAFMISTCWLNPAKQVSPLDDIEQAEKDLNAGNDVRGPGRFFARGARAGNNTASRDDDVENSGSSRRSRSGSGRAAVPPNSDSTTPSAMTTPPREIRASPISGSQQQKRRQLSQTSSSPQQMPSLASFDSQEKTQQQQQQQQQQSQRTKKKKSRVTVDDVTQTDAMEVYLNGSSMAGTSKDDSAASAS